MVTNDAVGAAAAPRAENKQAAASSENRFESLEEFRSRAEGWMKEVTAQVARLAASFENDEKKRSILDKRLADIEERIRSLLTLTEMISMDKNPFVQTEAPKGAPVAQQGAPALLRSQEEAPIVLGHEDEQGPVGMGVEDSDLESGLGGVSSSSPSRTGPIGKVAEGPDPFSPSGHDLVGVPVAGPASEEAASADGSGSQDPRAEEATLGEAGEVPDADTQVTDGMFSQDASRQDLVEELKEEEAASALPQPRAMDRPDVEVVPVDPQPHEEASMPDEPDGSAEGADDVAPQEEPSLTPGVSGVPAPAFHPNDAAAEPAASVPQPQDDEFLAGMETDLRGSCASSAETQRRLLVVAWADLLAPHLKSLDVDRYMAFYLEAGWTDVETARLVGRLAEEIGSHVGPAASTDMRALHEQTVHLLSRNDGSLAEFSRVDDGEGTRVDETMVGPGINAT